MDTEFWFASPQTHTVPPAFSEILSWRCFNPNTIVNVGKPALDTVLLANYYSPYNTLHLQISSYNTNPPSYYTVDSVCHYNTVSDHAYLVTCSSDAVVHVTITNPNSGSYLLKGRNALGTSFIIPAQWQYPNASFFPDSRNSVEVIATENNTVITINPSVDLYGGTHPAHVPFNISLNRGQVYCFAAASQSANGHLGGTEITSNNPVAVNMTDDAVTIDGVHYDIISDQLFPENRAGKEYVAVPSCQEAQSVYNGQSNDYALIYAIEDHTDVTVNGTGQPTQYSNLLRGDRSAYHFTDNTPVFISATKPVYVFQLCAPRNEPSGYLLIPLECHGSSMVFGYSFSPTWNTPSEHEIRSFTFVCEEDYVSGFQTINQFENTVNFTYSFDPAGWLPISGTTLRYYRLNLSMADNLQNLTTTNSLGKFHAVMQQYVEADSVQTSGSFSNGYADFPKPSILHWDTDAMPTSYCQGDSLTLSYVVENLSVLQISGPDGQPLDTTYLGNLTPDQSGLYIISGTNPGGCPPDPVKDTVLIEIHTNKFTIIEDSVCYGNAYLNHGFSFSADMADSLGKILTDTLYLQSSYGCDSVVTILLEVFGLSEVTITTSGDDFCDVGELVLTADSPASDYLWNTGETTPFVTATHSGRYSVTATAGECQATAFVDVPTCEFFLNLPNAITPSKSDGLNDCISIPAPAQRNITDFDIEIRNRWGELIYKTNDKSFRWCGENAIPDNVYTYVIRLKTDDSKPRVIRGEITVL